MINPEVHRRIVTMNKAPASTSSKVKQQTGITSARYVLRAGHKTSPLSSFGIIALGCGLADRGGEIDVVASFAAPAQLRWD
jgi:hypothetical protein